MFPSIYSTFREFHGVDKKNHLTTVTLEEKEESFTIKKVKHFVVNVF